MIHNFNSTNYIFLLLLCLAALAVFETPNDSFAQYGCVSIQTDKSSYTTNEIIFVSGSLCYFSYDVPVTIKVFDPDNNLIHVDQISVGYSDFSFSINTGGSLWKKSGQYLIIAQYYNQDKRGKTVFTISGVSPPSPTTSVMILRGSSVPGCEATDSCFDPSVITVNKGTKVTWYNDDNAAHTVTNVDLSVDPYNVGTVFDSSLLMPGKSFSHKFDAAGEYPYFCMVHPWMVGFVDVTGSPLPNTQFQPKEITHDVYIVLDWQVGSSPDRIKVYPSVTYDNGIPLPSYSGTVHFSKIYVDNQYKILAEPNQWSNDFYIGYGYHEIYAESPPFAEGTEEFLGSSSNIITIDLQPPTQGVTSTSIDPTIFIILGIIAAIGGGVAVAIMKRKSKPIKPIIPQPIPTTKSDDTMFYGCPRCGNNTKIFYGRQYCPVCKIYL